MSTQSDIRKVALDAGWTIKARVGESYDYARGGVWDRDIFVIGSVDRHLVDGTPVTEPEHEISVWYRRDGAVRHASGITFTVAKVLYHDGINGTVKERAKAARIIRALAAGHADIPDFLAIVR